MASNHDRGAGKVVPIRGNSLPLHRGVAPIPTGHLRMVEPREIAEALTPWADPLSYRAEPNDIYSSPAERARIARVIADERRDRRYFRLAAFIHWGSIGIALGTIVYFMFQLGRGAL